MLIIKVGLSHVVIQCNCNYNEDNKDYLNYKIILDINVENILIIIGYLLK